MSSIFSHGNSSILQCLDRGDKIELFQDTGNKNEKEDVVSEYEDKIDCCGDHHSHRLCDIFVNLPWFLSVPKFASEYVHGRFRAVMRHW
ncbi:unnamed protein product [Prunus armeniaca]|uniref:Uncharacterized protein n=1 Tax=Prunus armeniaca TaxID=36596 RepID=A0A6J5WRV0_PRUAR|nr:unnamed protein product [Prunus armeniaca]